MAIAQRLGLGFAALGRPGYITIGHGDEFADRSVEGMRAQSHAMLDAAWDAGIRFVDVARGYGLAESFLGSWLSAHPGRRDELTIESKWGYEYTANWQVDAPEHERKDHSLATFERQFAETLNALGTEPDLYLVHSLTSDSTLFEDAALLARLGELASAGVRVGFSTSGPAQSAVIERMLQLDGPFSAVQSTWNLLERSAADALADAAAAGWIVVVKEVFANGRLISQPAMPGVVAADQAALAAALVQPWADIVLTGVVTPAQLASNLVSPSVDGDEVVAHSRTPLDAKDYWSARSALTWH